MTTRDKGYKVGEWIGIGLGLATLLGLFASSVAWVSATNEKTAKVDGIDSKVGTLYLWARLVDSTNFRRAEQLSKEQP